MHKVPVNPLSQACPEKSVVRLTDRLDMTIAVDWDLKQLTKPNNCQDGLISSFLVLKKLRAKAK